MPPLFHYQNDSKGLNQGLRWRFLFFGCLNLTVDFFLAETNQDKKLMRYLWLFALTLTTVASSQISNVRQEVEDGHVIITYDLSGKAGKTYNIFASATSAAGDTIMPHAIAGDIHEVSPGKNLSIRWEPQVEGVSLNGLKVSLSAKAGIGIDWVFVQSGPTGDFRISKAEVTFAQFDEFCSATGYAKPDDNAWGRGNRPVINVNVLDAKAFCQWLSKETGKSIRLPEESEWEFAAKGGKKSNGYIFSGSNNLDTVGWYSSNSDFKTHEVSTKKPNQLGICDMSGNVWEWCGNSGAIRGGCWHDNDKYCRISGRFDNNRDVRSPYIGFRVLQK